MGFEMRWKLCGVVMMMMMMQSGSVMVSAQTAMRTTVDGEQCVFPLEYRGETKTDCFELAGEMKCKTASGLWKVCAPPGTAAAPRITTNGEACVFPQTYRGEVLTDCAMIGGKSQCKTEKNIWQECAPVGTMPSSSSSSSMTTASSSSGGGRVTVLGDACIFPVVYRGEELTDCAMIAGKSQCKTDKGIWQECAPRVSSAADVAAVTGGSRVTTAGEACVFPVVYRGEELNDCAMIAGRSQCKTQSGIWQECAPSSGGGAASSGGGRMTVNGNACVFPFEVRNAIFDDCTMITGKVSCKTASGNIEECAPMAAPSAPSAPASAPSGVRVTTSGDACVFPQPYRGDILTDCAMVAGKDQCKTAQGIWQECAPRGTTAPSSSSSSKSRATVTGKACVFPFEVRGAFFDDCTMLLGKLSCRVADGTVEQCEPIASSSSIEYDDGQRITLSGEKCIFPQTFRGQRLTDCAMIAGRYKCRTEKGWEECSPKSIDAMRSASSSSSSSSSSSPPPSAPTTVRGRTTIRGNACALPFIYRGATFSDCTMIAGKMSCMTERGEVEECAPRSQRQAPTPSSSSSQTPAPSDEKVYNVVSIFPRYALSSGPQLTVNGNECVFPFSYRGDIVYDCILISGVSRCKTDAGTFEECSTDAPASPGSSSPGSAPPSSGGSGSGGAGDVTKTVSGSTCVFPSTYRGEVVNACIEISNKLQCRSEKGIWEECASSSSSPAPSSPSSGPASGVQVTVTGERCVFPTVYRGQVLNECANLAGKSQCKTEKGLWQECAPPSAPAPAPAPAAGVGSTTKTVNGNECVFPLVYRGEVFNECMDVGGVKKCKTTAGIFETCEDAPSGGSTGGGDDAVTISFPPGSYYAQVYDTLSAQCKDEVTTFFTTTCRFTAMVLDYDPSNAGDVIEAKLEAISAEGTYDHVILAGYEFGDPVEAVSSSYPDIRYSVLDFAISPPLVNVEGIIFRDDQVGYLAGIVACKVSSDMTGRVAVISGEQNFTALKRVNGFRSGCLSVCPSCAVDFQYDSTFESIQAQLKAKPDVVFGSGTQLGHDGLKMAAAQGIYVIGVDADEWETTFQSGSVAGADMVLTSATKNVDVAAEESLNDGLDDSFRARNVLLGLGDDALALAGCHDACDVYTPVLQTQTRIALANLKSGSIDTGVHRVTGQPLVSLPDPPAPPVSSAYKVLGLFPTAPPFPKGSYYDQVHLTLMSLCTPRMGCEYTPESLSGPGEVQSTLSDRASSNLFNHIIMAGPEFGEPVKSVAPAFPLMRFTVMDYAFMPPLQNVEGIIFRDDQIGFLAGVVACEVAIDTDGPLANVAVVAGPEDMAASTKKRVNAFATGCALVCPDCKVDTLFGTNAQSMSQKISLRYPTVVFGSGTPVSHEVLALAAKFGMYVIGVDADEWVSTFENGSKVGADKVLTSALKMLDAAAARSLRDGLSNTFRGRNVLLDVSDDALAMADCHDACDIYSEPLRQQTAAIMSALASGSMDTGVNRVTGELTGVPPGTIPVAEASDDTSSGGISGLAIAIIVIVSVVAVGLAIFAFIILYKEKKGKPMFVTLDESEEMEKGKENELVANRSFSNVSSETSIKV